MALCILCDSQATITETTVGNLVNCSACCLYTLAEALFDELPKESDWDSLRGKLARAVRWRFYKGEPVTLINVLSARWLIAALNDERDSKEPAAVAALVGAGRVANPFHEPIIKLGKRLGLSPEEAFDYSVELLDRGVVKIVSSQTGWPNKGDQALPPLKAWEHGDGPGKNG